MQAFPPFYPDQTGCAYTYLVNPTGGLVGGDRIEIEIALQEQAHVSATTPSATKIYKSLGSFASQEMRVVVGREGVFEYFPHYVIPFAHSLYYQKAKIQMEENTRALILDFFTTGRLARGEHLQFQEYRSFMEIDYRGELILSDRFSLEPLDMDYSSLGFLESCSAVAVLYTIFDNPPLDSLIIHDLRKAIQGMKNVVGGVSTLPSKGVIVRLLGDSARFIEGCVSNMVCCKEKGF